MAARRCALVGLLAVAGATGCNEILGIEDRPPKPPTSTSTTAGSGGHGGDAGTGGGSGAFWARRFGDTTPEQSFRVAVDSRGGVLVSAIFGGFLTFDRILQASGPSDGCALKLSADGTPEWSLHASGPGTQDVVAVAFDADDAPYAAGNFDSTTWVGDYAFPIPTSNSFYAVQLKTSGELEQVFAWYTGYLHDLVVHDSGFSVFGSFNDSLTFRAVPPLISDGGKDGFAAQLDSNGSTAWANSVPAGDSDAEVRRAARDDAVTILSVHATTLNGPVAFLAFATNSDGLITTTSWSNLHGVVEVADLVITRSGTVVVVGSFTGTMQFDNTALLSPDEDIFFLAFEAIPQSLLVNVLALKQFGGVGRDAPHGLTVTPGGVAMTGVMSSAVDFGAGPLPYIEGEDAFVVELTETGDLVKGVAFGGPADQEGRDLAVDGDGNMVVTGIMEETLTINGEILYSGGLSDIFVAKLPW